jgi:hypothetical protein
MKKYIIFLLAFLSACSIPYIRNKFQPAETKIHVVLITIDGVRWQDIFNGPNNGKIDPRVILPNLYHYFVDQGIVIGRDSAFMATGPAHISLPGYLEIMRGHPSFDCQTNDCDPQPEDTMVDLFRTSAVFSSWDTIRKTVGANPDKSVINCGRKYRSLAWKQLSLPDDQKFPEKFGSDYRLDVFTMRATREYLRNHNPQFLWVSLGDTDEWAHHGDYERYIAALTDADRFIGELFLKLGSNNTVFIITADHGRGLDWHHHGWDSESARDWLMMTGYKIPNKGFVKYNNTKSLSDILPVVRMLIGHPNESLLSVPKGN